ncbi:TPA: hypothetical protein ACUUB5_001450 [Pseudomonas aeruginosa]|uniref:thymidylate synthase n=1 Tax=Pseudomonas aeruginosa TaxID=287 RepID=UPI00068CE2CB|nr:thymidylate synthase [Pseudomonas aeruginosa]MBH3513194.1 hypothetical protein [Pseudomonas aeruginosa]MDP5853354.1 hypothetical protein [Pseudomonas aeruginosa]HBN8616469.1 hypothetical protein [Pseudomonas aeruginosa]HBO3332047.1 hypothetical protein [Pseudomonas aeruginosa]HCL3990058.1 hypothetical protein [Pseudomonas aeruginosa]
MSKKASKPPLLIESECISVAWSKAIVSIYDGVGQEVSPMIVTITGFDQDGRPGEDSELRRALDQILSDCDEQSVDTVAFTIFPERLWRMSGGDRAKLFNLYKMAFPRYQAMYRSLNNRGLYFERLTNFNTSTPCDGNQLEWILSNYHAKPGIRRSMFQAATFDPARDHVSLPRLGFPCLQHLTFEPTAQGLVANAFYATQKMFIKAYGNYLGLAQLAAFMAHQMGIPLVRLNVMIGIAKLDELPKSNQYMKALVKAACECISRKEQSFERASNAAATAK